MAGLSDRAEEVLESLWIAIEERGAVPTTDALRDDYELGALQQGGLVEVADGRISLTGTGLAEATRCVRRHRLAERLLADVLDSSGDQMHEAGCKFEHGLHHGLEERVCTILGHPTECPHGKAIPPGECCRRAERRAGPLLCSLAEMDVNEPATIAYLHSDAIQDLRKLMAIGALPGTAVLVRQRFPSYLIELGASQFAIDEHMAGRIVVRRGGRHRA